MTNLYTPYFLLARPTITENTCILELPSSRKEKRDHVCTRLYKLNDKNNPPPGCLPGKCNESIRNVTIFTATSDQCFLKLLLYATDDDDEDDVCESCCWPMVNDDVSFFNIVMDVGTQEGLHGSRGSRSASQKSVTHSP
jgi:hypothetical protein